MIYSGERGAAFFYILMAIVFFAALTFAVTQGNRTSTSGATRDRAALTGNEATSYADTLAKTVQTLMLRGCSETEITFENPNSAGYTNAGAPTDNSCDLFNSDGGKLSWNGPENFGAAAVEFTGGCNVASVGTTSPDLMMVVEGLSLDACRSINEKLGVPQPSGNPITLPAACAYNLFTGAYTASGTVTVTGALGRNAACVQGVGAGDDFYAGRYHFYQVLIAR